MKFEIISVGIGFGLIVGLLAALAQPPDTNLFIQQGGFVTNSIGIGTNLLELADREYLDLPGGQVIRVTDEEWRRLWKSYPSNQRTNNFLFFNTVE